MHSFTLDTNCLIDLDEVGRPNKPHVEALVDMSRAGRINVSILASSASEKQIDGTHLDNIAQFRERVSKLKMDHLELLMPIGRWGLSFYDFAIVPTNAQQERENLIFRTLFPTSPLSWADFAEANRIDREDLTSAKAWKWRNRLCDAQAFWAHEVSKNEHFVTSDTNFKRKLTAASGFPDASILTPEQALRVATTTNHAPA